MKGIRLLSVIVTLILGAGIAAQGQVNSRSVWPMFRHDRKHTGHSPYSGPATPTLQWTYPTTDGVAASPSIGEDGTIYVGSGWFWAAQSDHGFYALNPDGSLKWRFEAGGGVFSSACIAEDGTIYFGSFDGNLYAIEDSVTYAKLKWTVQSDHKVMNSPIVADDSTVYFGALNFRHFAVDYFGNLKWMDELGWCVFASSAIDDDGYLLVGSKDHNLYKYDDLDTGFNILWNHSIGTFYDGHLIDASPAIGDDGTIYIACDQYGAAGQIPVPIDTAVFAVNPDGSRKWAFYVGDGVESSIGIGDDNMIYFGSYDSCFYAVRDMGTYGDLVWKYKTGGVVDASPTIGGDGTIYIGSRDSTMYAFNPDGSIRWTFDAGGDIESSVTIGGDGMIYFGGMDGLIYAVGEVGPDVGPVSIELPEFINPDSSVIPVATVRNFRTSTESFDVAFTVDTGGIAIYGDTVSVVDLAPGEKTEKAFASWAVGVPADVDYNLNVITSLAGDLNAYNDTLTGMASTGEPFVCGDASGNGVVNILDVTFVIDYLYGDGPAPDPLQSADANGDGALNILDITRLIDYLYNGGPAPDCG